MLFYSFFKSLVGKEVTVELKNDLGITGQLHSVDQYLNIKLNDIYVTEQGPVTIRKNRITLILDDQNNLNHNKKNRIKINIHTY